MAAWATAAQAQDAEANVGLQEIIVTAQKREQSIQDVPVAVTAVTAESLEANRIENVTDLNSITPGLAISPAPGGISQPFYSLRGLYTTGANVGLDRGVGLYIDGVYIGGASGTVFDMPDIERIEVLRGPQGTLFGRNSTGGAISIVTHEPDGEFGLKQRISYGNRDLLNTSTTVSLPQVGPLSAVISYTHSEERGDIRNIGAGTVWDYSQIFGRPTFRKSPKWLGGHNSEGVFASVKAEFDDLKLVYRFDHTRDHLIPQGSSIIYAGPAIRPFLASQNPALLTPVGNKKPDAVNNAGTTWSNTKITGHSLTATYQASDAVSFKNLLAYRTHYAVGIASELTGLSGLTFNGDPFLSALVNPAAARVIGAPFSGYLASNETKFKQWQEELQVNVDTDLFSFTGGGIYFRMRTLYGYPGGAKPAFFGVYPGNVYPNTTQPANRGGATTSILIQSYAAYGQAEVHVTDTVDLVGGLRWTKDKKNGIDRTLINDNYHTEFPLTYSGDKLTYSFGVNFKPNRDVLLYAKYSTGYVSGGSLSTLNYDPETAKSWEAGFKADLFSNTVRTNLAVYRVKYGGLQFNNSTTVIPALKYLLDQGVSTVILNAGSARAQGVEFEGSWAPTSSLVFSGNLGYMDFKYTFLEPFVTQGSAEFLVAGRPKWTGAVSAQYTSPELFDEAHFTARIDGNWRGDMVGPGSSVPLAGSFTWAGFDPSSFGPAEQAIVKKAQVNPSRWMVNARVALEDVPLGSMKGTLALWARNLLNEQSTHFRSTIAVLVGAYWEPDRAYGVDLTFEF